MDDDDSGLMAMRAAASLMRYVSRIDGCHQMHDNTASIAATSAGLRRPVASRTLQQFGAQRRRAVRQSVQALAANGDHRTQRGGPLPAKFSSASGTVYRVAKASSRSLWITTTYGMPSAALRL